MLAVAIGLGFVIFIHELGHFAVAKWCGVLVERFSIGFGPVILRIKKGETEYVLSAIPLGGYVKMLGQDDADPSQMTDANVAANPRSYTAKSVPQRMAIISAGVINNLISAVIFFMVAFHNGVQVYEPVIGQVAPGGPAWEAGLRTGDRITKINGRSDPQISFLDVQRMVALSGGPISLEWERDGATHSTTLTQRKFGDVPYPRVGVEPSQSLTMAPADDKGNLRAGKGTPVEKATPPFQGSDRIVAIDDERITSFAQLQDRLARRANDEIAVTVARRSKNATGTSADNTNGLEETTIRVKPNRVRTLGLHMDIGRVAAIRNDSPAAKAGLKPGDKLTHVITEAGEMTIGTDLDPLHLPQHFFEHAGKEVRIKARREVAGAAPVTLELTLVPDDLPGGTERGLFKDAPISIPALGVAYHVLHHVVKVDDKGPSHEKIQVNDNIIGVAPLTLDDKAHEAFDPFKFEEGKHYWAFLHNLLQLHRDMKYRFTVKSQGSEKLKEIVIDPAEAADRGLPIRGFPMVPLMFTKNADSVPTSFSMAMQETQDQVTDMGSMVLGLITGRLPFNSMGGPLKIGEVAYGQAQQGIAPLILFLGMLSVSLAVLNFLPIPVLDGGHFVFLLYEGIRGKPASETVIIRAQIVGLILLGTLIISVTVMDVSSWFARR